MAVGFCDEDSPVLVAYPSCNGLEIDADFDGVADEVVAEGVVGEAWGVGEFCGSC